MVSLFNGIYLWWLHTLPQNEVPYTFNHFHINSLLGLSNYIWHEKCFHVIENKDIKVLKNGINLLGQEYIHIFIPLKHIILSNRSFGEIHLPIFIYTYIYLLYILIYIYLHSALSSSFRIKVYKYFLAI